MNINASASPRIRGRSTLRVQEHGGLDYSKSPLIVYWEMTRACPLACRHCRAEAMAFGDPEELSTDESKAFLHQVAEFDDPKPQLILTGGDPLQRADLYEMIDDATRLGIRVSITPSATQNLTVEVLQKLKKHAIEALGVSLDGSCASRHEAVRGVPGCFEWTIAAVQNAAKLGIPVQINSLVCKETVDDLPALYELLSNLNIMRWSLFFLIAVGRGKTLEPISPEHGERLMNWIYDISGSAPFAIKTTEAPSYRRVALQRMRDATGTVDRGRSLGIQRGFGIRDGHGIVFVSNKGDIYPAGFLPLAAGNVRNAHLTDVYRNSPLFRALHAPGNFKGKCGRCEYRSLCGGSRSRAFAATGDPLESDPFCPYQPPDDETKHCRLCRDSPGHNGCAC